MPRDSVTNAATAELMQRGVALDGYKITWTITQNINDHNGKFVARASRIKESEVHLLYVVLLADTLEMLRAQRPTGFITRIPTQPQPSDPIIIEVWEPENVG